MRGIGCIREVNGVIGAPIAIAPYPLTDIALAGWIGTQIREMTRISQAVGGIETEECIRMGAHFHRVTDAVCAIIGVFHIQNNSICAIGWKYMVGIGRGIKGGKSAIAKVPVPGTRIADIVATDSKESGIRITYCIGCKISNRNGVHDNRDGIFHHGNTIHEWVDPSNRVLPGYIFNTKT